jgi:hypothetical protein
MERALRLGLLSADHEVGEGLLGLEHYRDEAGGRHAFDRVFERHAGHVGCRRARLGHGRAGE